MPQNAKLIADRIPGAVLKELPGGHLFMSEYPGAVQSRGDRIHRRALNLEVILLRALALRRLPGRVALELLQFILYFAQMLAELLGLEFHSGFASDAYEMSLGVLLDLMDNIEFKCPHLGHFTSTVSSSNIRLSPAQVSL